MITNFKIFENINNVPDIGDYILVGNIERFGFEFDNLINFMSTNIAKVTEYIYDDDDNIRGVKIKYNNNIPNDIRHHFPKNGQKSCQLKYILAFAKTRKELETIILANKYNI
jgi:hypothetical protein